MTGWGPGGRDGLVKKGLARSQKQGPVEYFAKRWSGGAYFKCLGMATYYKDIATIVALKRNVTTGSTFIVEGSQLFFRHCVRTYRVRCVIAVWNSAQHNHPCDTFSNFPGQAKEE